MELKILKEQGNLNTQITELQNIGDAPSNISKRIVVINIEGSITEIKMLVKQRFV